LFLFGIGYSVGPQFLRTLKSDGLRPIGLGLCVTLSGLLAAWAVASTLGLDPGFAAGLTSGALTESPAMGTATEAINSLPLPAEERSRLIGHIAVADALCYVFGAFGVIWFCSALGPKLLHIDLEEEASKLEAELGIEPQEARRDIGVAAVRLARLSDSRGRVGGREDRRPGRDAGSERPTLHPANPARRADPGGADLRGPARRRRGRRGRSP
jgi:uncharacterized transporter YbjL